MATPSESSTPTSAAAPASATSESETNASATPASGSKPNDAFVKLAMRNMVSKGGKSLFHFGLTLVGLLTVLVGLAYLTR